MSYAFTLIAAGQIFFHLFYLHFFECWSYWKYSKYNSIYQSEDISFLTVESIDNIGQSSQNFVNEIGKLVTNEVKPVNISLILCKLRIILPQWSRLILASIICFVAMDDLFCSNPMTYLRQLDSLKMCRYQIFLAAFLSKSKNALLHFQKKYIHEKNIIFFAYKRIKTIFCSIPVVIF
jgi:hypothetical protein